MRKLFALIVIFALIFGLASTVSAVVKKKVVKKKIVRRRYHRPYYPLGSRPKFPTASDKPVVEPAPEPEPVAAPPAPEPKPALKAGWFVEGGVAGGGLAVGGGYGKQLNDKLYVSGAAGFANGFVVIDLVRASYDLGKYYVGGGLSYANSQAGAEIAGGVKINDRLSARLGLSTCLGLRVAASYDLGY
jgi:hypothetical protein